MSMIPYQKLTDEQKKVTFHVDGSSDDPVRHSGILPSGEGNHYDPNQIIRNDKIFDAIDPSARNPVLLGRSSNHPNDPIATPPSTFQPSGLEYSNITQSGVLYNGEAYDQQRMPTNGNALSNNTEWANSGLLQGGYIHYVSNFNTSLLPDNNAVEEYFPQSMISATSGVYNPYAEYGYESKRQTEDQNFFGWFNPDNFWG